MTLKLRGRGELLQILCPLSHARSENEGEPKNRESAADLKRLPLSLARNDKDVTVLPPLSREEAMAFFKSNWQKSPDMYAFFNHGQENLFVVIPEGENLAIRVRVYDAFGLLGFVGKQRAVELDFGVLQPSDADRLLKLFFEGNYLALRPVHRGLMV